MSDPLELADRPPANFHTSVSLLARVRARDESAWDQFHAIYSPLIQYVCGRWGLSGPDADDVSQEVFKSVVSHIDTYRRERDGQVRSFRNWLGGVIRNKVRDHFQRQASLPLAGRDLDSFASREENDEPDAGEDEAFREVFRRALERIRGEFPDRHWQAFWRTSIDGQLAPEVAAELGMNAAAVRQAKSRVLRRLRDELCEAPELD